MMKFVHRPRFECIVYSAKSDFLYEGIYELIINKFDALIHDSDIMQDPYAQHLSKTEGPSSSTLSKIIETRKTDCIREIKRLRLKSIEIYTQLGMWPLHWYLHSCVARIEPEDNELDIFGLDMVREREREHLYRTLSSLLADTLRAEFTLTLVESEDSTSSVFHSQITEKLTKLIDLLVEEAHEHYSGLIFVKQRATVAVLAHIIAKHPRTRSQFFPGTFVGSASVSKKADFADLVTAKEQQQVLDDFKDHSKPTNLLISTSVLEEGIDIPACHNVICFDPPENLVSFVQRRGRVRRKDSRFVVFLPDSTTACKDWENLEEEMRQAYMEETSSREDDFDLPGNDLSHERRFCVESTG